MKIQVNTENIKLFQCLSSKTRLEIIEILCEGPKNIGELAHMLGLSSAIITRHIADLEDSGIIISENTPGKRGVQKKCFLSASEIILAFQNNSLSRKFSCVSIPVGQYTAYSVSQPCGLASTQGFIGVCDDPRYFSDPGHINASLIWFQSGWVEYNIPSYIITSPRIKAIEISFEICSEYPNYKNDWPSEINFHLNGKLLGMWLCPGDFGDKKGVYTPGWWNSGTEYGLLKTLRISDSGCMLDGIPLSSMTLKELSLETGKDLLFRISSPPDSANPGGVNIFGRGFGNYNQDIEVRVEY